MPVRMQLCLCVCARQSARILKTPELVMMTMTTMTMMMMMMMMDARCEMRDAWAPYLA